MEYIVLGEDDKEYGPVDGETLKKWVEHGRVFKDTQIRNALMKKWNEAGTLDFLEEAFDLQEVHEEEEEGVGGKLKDMLGLKQEHDITPEGDVKTAFKYTFIPNPASVGQRIGAFAVDSLVMACLAILLFLMMNSSAGTMGLGESSPDADFVSEESIEEGEEGADTTAKTVTDDDGTVVEEDSEGMTADPYQPFVPTKQQIDQLNNSFGSYFFIFMTGVFLYYGIGLGVFAQTYGMWFWGIIIVKGYDYECFPARALAYTVAMFAIGITTPIVVAVNPLQRSLQGYLTGTRLIRVAAKPKS